MRTCIKRTPLPLLLLLFAAPFGCTAILGDFELGPSSGADAGGTPDGASGDASDETSTSEAGADHFAGAKAVTAGARHTCALNEQNEVFCWGDNTDGQLGLPPSTARSERPVKVNVPPDVKSLVAGAFHTCVVTNGFEAFCWGRNACGQVGAGDAQNPSPEPRKVIPTTGGQALQFIAISPGADHTCAIEAGGATYCWGCNPLGQAGYVGAETTDRPTNAGADKQNATAVSASARHTCITQRDAVAARCWGSEERGALGDGPPLASSTLDDGTSRIAELGSVLTGLAAGEQHTCALDGNRAVRCWGDNRLGQVGAPDVSALDAPGPAVPESVTYALATGGRFTCFIKGIDDTVHCFGSNEYGELGRAGAPDSASHITAEPVVFPGVPGAKVTAKSIAAGRDHACAILGSSEILCWGKGNDGQLGDGTAGGNPRTVPVFVVRP